MTWNKRLSLVLILAAAVAGGLWLIEGSPTRADVVLRSGGQSVITVGEDEDGPVVRVIGDETGYLGVNIEEEVDHAEGGARVTDVVDESPAAEAGLREGDIIVGFDGNVIRGPAALTRRIHEMKPGESVRLEIVRDGARRDVEVELGRRSDLWKPLRIAEGTWVLPDVGDTLQELQLNLGDLDLDLEGLDFDLEGLGVDLGDIGERIREGLAPLADCEGDDCYFIQMMGSRPKLGVQLVETTVELRRHLGGSGDAGVLVSKVLTGMPAERAGIEVGDLIVAVGGDEVDGVSDLRRALKGHAGETFEVELIRDGRERSVEVTLPEPEEIEAPGPRARVVYPSRAPIAHRRVPSAVVPAPPAVPRAPRVLIAPAVPRVPEPAPPAPRRLPAHLDSV